MNHNNIYKWLHLNISWKRPRQIRYGMEFKLKTVQKASSSFLKLITKISSSKEPKGRTLSSLSRDLEN